MSSIRIGLLGYGNLGRGVELACATNPDTELVAVFTRRDPSALEIRTPGATVYPQLIWRSTSMTSMCWCSRAAARPIFPSRRLRQRVCSTWWIPSTRTPTSRAHFAAVDAAAHEGGKVAVISVGWDRHVLGVAPVRQRHPPEQGRTTRSGGRGVSQGHSDAVRRIPGVRDARQYTVPVPAALDAVRAGEMPELSTRERHTRECFVVAEERADKAAIEQAIVTMPHYFADYDTTVTFITEEELQRDHAGIPHGGSVIRTRCNRRCGREQARHQYSLTLDSNPEFTGSVLVAFARAAYRLSCEGSVGCKTIFDIAPAYLSP